jgi:Asp-tRNA(Asn)/Glu-tRNA(Gln) amidotransferase A subunit family amidase
MKSQDIQFKINNLKYVLANFNNEEKKLIGVTIIRENSSDNWLFNTDVDITSIVPTVTKALESEIAELESQLPSLEQAEAQQKAIEEQNKAQAEAERLAQEQAELEAKKQAEWEQLILKQKQILLAQEEAKKLIEAEKLTKG